MYADLKSSFNLICRIYLEGCSIVYCLTEISTVLKTTIFPVQFGGTPFTRDTIVRNGNSTQRFSALKAFTNVGRQEYMSIHWTRTYLMFTTLRATLWKCLRCLHKEAKCGCFKFHVKTERAEKHNLLSQPRAPHTVQEFKMQFERLTLYGRSVQHGAKVEK